MTRRDPGLMLLIGWLAVAAAAAQPSARTDVHGDPLSPDTVARLGTPWPGKGGAVTAVTFTLDGKFLLVASAKEIRCLEITTGKQVGQPLVAADDVLSLAVTRGASGRILVAAAARSAVHVWDLPGGKKVRDLPAGAEPGAFLAFSPDGNTLLTPVRPGGAAAWDIRTGKSLRLQGNDEPAALALAASPHGDALAALGEDDRVRTWDALTRKAERSFGVGKFLHGDGDKDMPEYAGALSPGGRWAAWWSVSEQAVCVWEVATGAKCLEFLSPWGRPQRLAYSPDGRWLLGGPPGEVWVWDAATGERRGKFRCSGGSGGAAAFAPDGKILAAGQDDGTVLLWPAPARPGGAKLSSAELEPLWQALGGEAKKALRAVARLADVPTAAAALRERLLPPASELKQVVKAVEELGAPRYADRERAERRLEKLGAAAVPALAAALAGAPSEEARQRIGRLLARLDGPAGPGGLQALRALAALERAGTAEARAVLAEVVRAWAGSWRAAEAAAALRRLR